MVVGTQKIICVISFEILQTMPESSEACFCLSRKVNNYGLLQPKEAGRN